MSFARLNLREMERFTGLSGISKKVSLFCFEMNRNTIDSDDEQKMLKGIALFGDQQKREVELEIGLLRRLGNFIFEF